MRPVRRLLSLGGLALALAAAGFVLSSRPMLAHACGGFFPSTKAESKRRASLALEQTLIIFDAERHREHFVREVVFRTSRTMFGFVIPTPTRPEVARAAKNPFPVLRTYLPYEVRPGTGSGQGFGSGRGGVQVLEAKKIGSFTAFVLAADDAGALADWLKKNHLVSTPEADVWLAHYVRMKFFYVAMRYDPPAEEQGGRTAAETMRISFDTELAYYPYFEPDPPAGARGDDDPRMLDLWYVANQRSVPVALRTREQKASWVRPFAEGRVYPDAIRTRLEEALGDDAKLLPRGQLLVQRFADQKIRRIGFGDAVFVPEAPTKLRADRLGPLMGVLDPALEAGAKP